MWGSRGRSGYGDTNLDGTYDDVISGISPNGRQYRNEITGETRNLSGADYWHLRKQNRPTEEIPAHLHMINGMANIDVYGKLDQPKKQTKIDIRDKILPQEKRLSTLTQQLIELEQEYKQGNMSIDEYSMYRAVAITRRDRAWILYCKAIGISPTCQNDEETVQVKGETTFNIDDVQATSAAQSSVNDNGFVASIPDGNIFKGVVEKACKGWKLCVKFKTQASNYIQTLKEV